LHRRLADAIKSREVSVDENAALIAEHLEAAGDLRAAYSWHMRAGTRSQRRDIAAAEVSWGRAARIADMLPADDPDRLAMRIAPRTLSCANVWRIRKPVAGKRFEELQDLCAAAGDKASVAIAMAGLVSEHLIKARLAEASRLATEYMVLIESIGDPNVTVGLALFPAAVKFLTGEVAQALRWSQMVIDLAEGDRALGDYIVGSPLALAYAVRSSARSILGRAAWREDFNRAVAMARDADPISQAVVIVYTYNNATASGVIVADDAALHEIDEALQNAQRAADDIALGFALYAKANVLLHRDSAQWERGLDLLRQVHEMAADGRYYALMMPVIDARIAEVAIRRGDRGAVPLLRASVDELYSSELLGYWLWGTGVLVEALLEGGTDSDVQEAEAAVEQLSTQPALDGWAWRDLVLLRLRALLARARGDEVSYRNFRDRYRAMAKSLGFEGHIAMGEAMA
jgi:adenylate cyclase